MKSAIFSTAISKRNRIQFLYGLDHITVDPYYISSDRDGTKVLYGRTLSSNEIKKFKYKRIANIKVINNVKFSPIIPIISQAS